ncbi:MAG: IS21-like element helper ATPase IstB [Myxococcales bacterium]|nr:MAG: IS21-like element helper ATPase IstB [Myxococcales bacterium]
MLNEPTLEKLRDLRLNALAETWSEQRKDPKMTGLDFDERFGLLVDAEWLDRQNKRLARNLREAKLRLSDACIEGIDYPARRKLDKAVIRGLASCTWIHEHHNVVITGPTGVGKTYIACALAQQACRKGYRALYRRVPRIFDEILLARADGTYPRWLAKVARFDVIVLDDWGLVPLAESERRDLLEIMEDRYGNRSTILTSQMPVAQWHDQVGDPTIADAFCDRLLHNAHRIELHGPSRRQEKKKQN